MKTYKFQQEDHTEVFINTNGSITILQIDGLGHTQTIVAGSKERAVGIARAIIALAKIATFKTEGEEQDGR